MRMTSITMSLLLFVFIAGCKNPTSGKPRAAVGEAMEEKTEKPLSEEETGATYEFSNDGSRIDWVGSKVTGSHDGGFEMFSGTFQVPGGEITDGQVKVEIDLTSIWSDSDKLTEHLNSPDFFETEKFPEASFTSTSIEEGGEGDATHTVTGNLDLHGQKKSITFPAKIAVTDDGFEASTEFALDRKLFGIDFAGMPDDLIKDDVLVKLDVKGATR